MSELNRKAFPLGPCSAAVADSTGCSVSMLTLSGSGLNVSGITDISQLRAACDFALRSATKSNVKHVQDTIEDLQALLVHGNVLDEHETVEAAIALLTTMIPKE